MNKAGLKIIIALLAIAALISCSKKGHPETTVTAIPVKKATLKLPFQKLFLLTIRLQKGVWTEGIIMTFKGIVTGGITGTENITCFTNQCSITPNFKSPGN